MDLSNVGLNKRYRLLSSASKSLDLNDSKNNSKSSNSLEFSDLNKRQIDIVARLEQDNKMLAELEKYQSSNPGQLII